MRVIHFIVVIACADNRVIGPFYCWRLDICYWVTFYNSPSDKKTNVFLPQINLA